LKKNCKQWKSNLPAELQEVQSSLAINQNAFLVREEDILAKSKRKEQFDGELLMLWKKYNPPRKTTIKLTFGLARRLQT